MKKFIILLICLIPTIVFANTAPVPVDATFIFKDVKFSQPDANRNVAVQGMMVNSSPNNYNTVAVTMAFFNSNNEQLSVHKTQINNVVGNSSNTFKFALSLPQGAVKYKIDGEVPNTQNTDPKNDSTANNGIVDPSQILGLFMGYLPQDARNMLGVFINNLPNVNGGIKLR